MRDKTQSDVRGIVLGTLNEAVRGKPVPATCDLCHDRFDGRDSYECADGVLCLGCASHPRFDLTTCPRCGRPWEDTIKPCECGMTVVEVQR